MEIEWFVYVSWLMDIKDAIEERKTDIQLRRSNRKRKGNPRLANYEESDDTQSGQKKKKL